jgi:hypothetical protein
MNDRSLAGWARVIERSWFTSAPEPPDDVAYTLTVHDEKYPGLPDQVVGVFSGENAVDLAVNTAFQHWSALAGPDATLLVFAAYHSSNTGHDFHVAEAFRDYEPGKVTYSVNGFTVQQG